jgi:protocatechuate 3,4-dioxygenase, alpha subunit
MGRRTLEPTPSQTIGPFFHDALLATDQTRLVSPDHPDAVSIHGIVYDGAGEPVTDAMIELWQADGAGRYGGEGFTGFGRSGTTDDGRFEFVTIKPGGVPGLDERMQAPHVNLSVFARGLLRRLVTRLYFPDEAEANATDPVLCTIEDLGHRATLVAVEEAGGYRFDIHLQGERQTVFFDV